MESFEASAIAVLDCTRITQEKQEAAIAERAMKCFPFKVRGWRAAERNLDLPCEWMARFFFGVEKSYFEHGGIEGAVARSLNMPQSPWRVVARTKSFGTAQVTLSLEKIGDSGEKA